MLERLGAWGQKTSYGKTTWGVLRSHWVIGPDGRIVAEQVKVSPAESVERALKTLRG